MGTQEKSDIVDQRHLRRSVLDNLGLENREQVDDAVSRVMRIAKS